MVEVSFSSSFRRAFKKRIKGNIDLEARFWQKVEQFTIDPFDFRVTVRVWLSCVEGVIAKLDILMRFDDQIP